MRSRTTPTRARACRSSARSATRPGAWRSSSPCRTASTDAPLADAPQERQNALLELRRSLFVVVGETAVGEQVLVARVQEELGALDRLDELPRCGQILLGPL